MPKAKYSAFAITDPEHQTGFSRGTAHQPQLEMGSRRSVLAKEPDRQSTPRRTASRGRSVMETEPEQVSAPRGRSARGPSQQRGIQQRRASQGSSTARRSTTPEARTGRQKKSRRGFAAMSPEQQRAIARKGGLTVSRNRRHMADIGRVGGEHSHGGRRAKR